MKFSISRNGGQYQFWHMDCDKGSYESPMYDPEFLANDVKEFKCVGCNKVGRATMPRIVIGTGELELCED